MAATRIDLDLILYPFESSFQRNLAPDAPRQRGSSLGSLPQPPGPSFTVAQVRERALALRDHPDGQWYVLLQIKADKRGCPHRSRTVAERRELWHETVLFRHAGRLTVRLGPNAMASLKVKGDLAELKVAGDLAERGYRIAIPFGEDWNFDLIFGRHRVREAGACAGQTRRPTR
jgi:hypothetical protein